MCGIIGFVDKKKRLTEKECAALSNKMLQEIEYRGRDNSSTYTDESTTLGHNRLAILDRSVRSDQPFLNKDQSIVMCYNGEIFNHINLHASTKDGMCQPPSDTKTFMSLYEEWREDSFKLIRGMFAVSFYNKNTQEITLAIDQFGIKPLYYIDTPDWFAWSSELKVFKSLPNICFTTNEEKLFEHAIFRTTMGSETMLDGVSKLSPGEFLKYNLADHSFKKTTYSHLQEESLPLKQLLEKSVSEHMLSDVPIGLQLSGGLDSSLISAIAVQNTNQKNIHSFSIGLAEKEWNEFEYSRKVASQLQTTHHEILFTQEEFCKNFPVATYHLDEPIAYPNTVPLMILAKEAGKHVKVLLSGEGADELFGGYTRYTKLIEGSGSPEDILFSNAFCMPDEVLKLFVIDSKNSLKNRLDLVESGRDRSLAEKISLYDLKTFLPSLLLRQDKMGMASHVENRFPFLDQRIVAYALHLENKEKFTAAETKIALKKVAENYLPNEIIYRKKCGFGLPIASWLKNDSGFGKYLNLLRHLKTKRSYLNYDAIEEYITEHLSGTKDRSEVLWILISLEIWTRIFIDRENPYTLWNSF